MVADTANLLDALAHFNANTNDCLSRFRLAKQYYLLGFSVLAAREVKELITVLPNNQRLKILLQRLDPSTTQIEGDSIGNNKSEQIDTVAEADFDIGDLEEILEDR